jgi:hypothetical protein
MAFEFSNYSVKITRVAGADLSALQYTFVKLSTTDTVVTCSAATDIPIGVLQNAPTSGQEAEVLIVGGTKLTAGATIAIGNILGVTATGTASVLTVSDTTKYVLGSAISGGASAEIITAVINCANPTRAN